MGLKQFMDQSLMLIRKEVFNFLKIIIWTSYVSVYRLDLRLRRCRLDRERKFGARAAILCGERRGPHNFRGVASGCALFRGKMYVKTRSGREKCPLFRV